MYMCNNIQEKEATQVYLNHMVVSPGIQLISCVLSAPTPAKVTLAIRRVWQKQLFLNKNLAEKERKTKPEVQL